jgi:drug/metabolite transporter (DMT)-like permease
MPARREVFPKPGLNAREREAVKFGACRNNKKRFALRAAGRVVKPSYLILLLLMNFFWAAVYSAYKILGPEIASGGIVTLRFGLAGVSLLLVWPWLPGDSPRGRDLAKTFLMGLVLYAVGQRLQVYGNQIGTAGNSSVLMALEPLTTSLAAAIFLREHIGPRRLAGFALGLLGVGLLNGVWRKDFEWSGLNASLIFISSFICEAGYSVIGKTVISRASPIKMVAISLLVGLGANLLIDGGSTIVAARSMSVKGWILLLSMALICTSFGYSLWFIVIRDCPVNVAALTIFAQAVFGVIIAAVWLREKLHLGQLLGSLVIVAGLVLGLSRQVQKAESRPAEGPAPTP